MSSIRTGTGLISGLNINQLIEALVSAQSAQVARLQNRINGIQATQTGVKTLDANALTILSAAQTLGASDTFAKFKVANSDETQVGVTARNTAVPGSYQFQALQLATTHVALSKGFVNSDKQAVGSGTLIIANGGGLHAPTLLDALNGGEGIRRGAIRITDRAGHSAEIDLSSAHTVDDVLEAISSNGAIGVTATAEGGRLVLRDDTGGSVSNLIVADVGDSGAATDLGLAQSVAADTLTGELVYRVTGDFTLSQINDGNQIDYLAGAPALQLSLADGASFEVTLDGAVTVNDILDKINSHESNAGKLSAALVDGRIEFVDNTTGVQQFTIANANDSSVVDALGLNVASVGGEITGRRLVAGLNSVLLRNLRGGEGIAETGTIRLRDRTGLTADVDLTRAESLDEVLNGINNARAAGNLKLNLTARVNAAGTGIEVVDASGGVASNLVIEDVGAGTLAAQLGIAVNAATDTVDSGRLDLRYVNAATSLSAYSPSGDGVEAGTIRIVDSAGNVANVEISAAVRTVGDVIERINLASGIEVRAELNQTGDGFVLIDEAGGANALRVEEVGGGSAAADLRILGEGSLGPDGQYRIQSRLATVVDVAEGDTLDVLVGKIQGKSAFVNATVVDDGSPFSPKRLSLAATQSGAKGRLLIDAVGIDLGLRTTVEAQDALLRVGSGGSASFVLSSSSNQFNNAVTGVDVEVLDVGDSAANVTVSRDADSIVESFKKFTDAFNTFIGQVKELTKFDVETNVRGVLKGNSTVLRFESRLTSLVTRPIFGQGNKFRALVDLGVNVKADGKIELDEKKLRDALAADPQLFATFFTEKDKGFAKAAENAVKQFTDPLTGVLTGETNSLQTSVDALENRIDLLNEILEVRRTRLVEEFSKLETLLSELQSQQLAIGGIAPISV